MMNILWRYIFSAYLSTAFIAPNLRYSLGPTKNLIIRNMQALDYTSLHYLCHELQCSIVPSRIENVVQYDQHSVAIQLRTSRDELFWLTICWNHIAARVTCGEPPPISPDSNIYSFGSTVRNVLKGLYLQRIALPDNYDRVIDMEISNRIGQYPDWRIRVEIIGARSNSILMSASDNVIVACAYQVSSSQSIRPLQTGSIYKPPPDVGGMRSPDSVTDETMLLNHLQLSSSLMPSSKNGSLSELLTRTYKGMSPNIALDLLTSAGIPLESSETDLSKASITNLYRLFRLWRGGGFPSW